MVLSQPPTEHLTLHLHPQAAHNPVAPVGSPVGSSVSLIPEDGLPPILISTGVKGGTGGHITGACLHPHPSTPLLRQPMCFLRMTWVFFMCFFIMCSCFLRALIVRRRRREEEGGGGEGRDYFRTSFSSSHLPILILTPSHHHPCLFFFKLTSSNPSAPLLLHSNAPPDYAVEERPSEIVLLQQLEEGGPDPLVFVLNANLLAMVKLVNCE